MLKFHSPKEMLDYARSSEATSEELDFLAQKEYDFVKVAVAGNKRVYEKTLLHLIPLKINTRHDQEMALTMARNPVTTQEMLQILIERIESVVDNGREHQVGFQAGLTICNNEKTRIDDIRKFLASDKVSTEFRKVLARETTRKDVLDLLAQDRSEKVRRRVYERQEERKPL